MKYPKHTICDDFVDRYYALLSHPNISESTGSPIGDVEDDILNFNIPLSDIVYVRASVEQATGRRLSIKETYDYLESEGIL